MKRKLIFTFSLVAFLFCIKGVKAEEVHAQVFKMQLANPSQTINVGDNFDIQIMINTAGQSTINGDALITYDPNAITIDSSNVKTGNFYTYFSANPLGGYNNKFLISSWEESVAHAKSTSTDALFATMTVAAKNPGTTTLSFDCTTGNEADSNINLASDSSDIIKCPLQPLTINIGGAAQPTAAPTSAAPTSAPTTAPAATSTPIPLPTKAPRPTVAELKRAGGAEMTILGLGVGFILTVVGVVFAL
ncbi:hypothetical protein M1271_04415 [Patescibacteria group bacterium]|nr:hypothetical protein [Patescibacteria group bacterium]